MQENLISLDLGELPFTVALDIIQWLGEFPTNVQQALDVLRLVERQSAIPVGNEPWVINITEQQATFIMIKWSNA